jgi:hypothetical protein
MSGGLSHPDVVHWKKSSHSMADGNCVEVAICDERVLIRDSKSADGACLNVPLITWREFIAGVRVGEMDGPRIQRSA